jgi:hypothetical protein
MSSKLIAVDFEVFGKVGLKCYIRNVVNVALSIPVLQ